MKAKTMTAHVPALAAALLALWPAQCVAQRTFFAVSVDGSAYVIPAVYQEGVVIPEVPAAARFRQAPLSGMSMNGARVQVELLSIVTDPEYGDPDLEVRVVGPVPPDPSAALSDSVFLMQESSLELNRRPPQDSSVLVAHYDRYANLMGRWLDAYSRNGTPHAVLLWAGPDGAARVPSVQSDLDPATVMRIRNVSDSLLKDALDDLPPDERDMEYQLGYSFVLSPEGSATRAAVWAQAVSSSGDPRGAFFFLLDGERILRSEFGHPEWSPNSDIELIRPYMFVRIGADPRLLLLCHLSGAWEDLGTWVFLDVATGQTVARR